MESAAPDASRQCAAASARRLRARLCDLEGRLEQAGHPRRLVTKVVVFSSPSFVNLVLSGLQGLDPSVETLFPVRQAEDIRFDPIAGRSAHNFVAPSPRGA